MQGPSAKPAPKVIILMLAALACLSLALPARAQTAPQGWWLDQTKRAGILIAPCGNQLCGRIEWLKSPLDPEEAERRATRTPRRKRFYGSAEVADAPGGLAILLDGKPVRTPSGRSLVAPTREIADAIAAAAQA